MSIYSSLDDDEEYRQDRKRIVREKFKPIKNSFSVVLGLMLLSILIGFLSFGFIYWCLSIINIHYALKSLISWVVSYFLLLLIKPDTDFKTRILGASKCFLFMATIIGLLVGFRNYGAGPLDDYFRNPKANIYVTDSATLVSSGVKIITVESGILKRKGEKWSTEKVFSADSSVIIKVSNQEVRFVGFYILKPGMYKKIINKNEKLTFEGVSDKTSIVSVGY